MKKICLIISFIICLLCFVGCKNQNDIQPIGPDNPDQVQSGDINTPVIPDDESNISNPTPSGDVDIPTTPDETGNTTPEEPNNSSPDDGNVTEPSDEEKQEEINLSEKMTNIVTKAQAEARMPMQEAIPAENAEGFIGLTTDEFNQYVEDSVVYESMISPANQSLCLIKVNDASKVEELKKAIFEKSNPAKWICMSAERVIVINSGNYIFLGMASSSTCDELIKAFSEEFNGNVGETLSRMAEE